MATIDQNLIRLNNVKTSWRQALASKGQEVSADASMESYVVATGGIQPVLQDKSVEITENGTTTVSADTGYDGLNEVEITTNVAGGDETVVKMNPSATYSSTAKQPSMFAEKIKEIKINTSSEGITSLGSFFRGLTALEKVEINIGDNITGMSSCFNECSSLKTINLLNVDNITNMSSAFRNTTSLEEINLTETSSVTNIQGCFYNATTSGLTPKLKRINGIINLDKAITEGTSVYIMFGSSNTTAPVSLQEVRIKNLSINLDLKYLTALSHDSLVYLINNLKTVSRKTLSLGTTNLAKLTEEEKAIATAKGWTLE